MATKKCKISVETGDQLPTLEELGYVVLPLSKLVKAPWNYRQDDDEMAATLTENIRKNGQLENVIVREIDGGLFELTNGNHRYDSYSVLQMPYAVCCNLGRVSITEAQRIGIETNETNFKSDTLKLADLLRGISEQISTEELAKTMPYSREQLQNFIELNQFDWEQYEKSFEIPDPGTLPASGDNQHFVVECGSEAELQHLCELFGDRKQLSYNDFTAALSAGGFAV